MPRLAAPHSVTCIWSTVGVLTRVWEPRPASSPRSTSAVAAMSAEDLPDQRLPLDRDRGQRPHTERERAGRSRPAGPGQSRRRSSRGERDSHLPGGAQAPRETQQRSIAGELLEALVVDRYRTDGGNPADGLAVAVGRDAVDGHGDGLADGELAHVRGGDESDRHRPGPRRHEEQRRPGPGHVARARLDGDHLACQRAAYALDGRLPGRLELRERLTPPPRVALANQHGGDGATRKLSRSEDARLRHDDRRCVLGDRLLRDRAPDDDCREQQRDPEHTEPDSPGGVLEEVVDPLERVRCAGQRALAEWRRGVARLRLGVLGARLWTGGGHGAVARPVRSGRRLVAACSRSIERCTNGRSTERRAAIRSPARRASSPHSSRERIAPPLLARCRRSPKAAAGVPSDSESMTSTRPPGVSERAANRSTSTAAESSSVATTRLRSTVWR